MSATPVRRAGSNRSFVGPIGVGNDTTKSLGTVGAGMLSVVDAIGLATIVLGNTAIAALLTRFFRVRMTTTWAGAVYAVLSGSLALLVSTLVLGGFLGLGPDLASPAAVVGLTIVGPLAVGITIDYVWMPAPEDVELPERREESPSEPR